MGIIIPNVCRRALSPISVQAVGCFSNLFLKLSIYLRLVSFKADDITKSTLLSFISRKIATKTFFYDRGLTTVLVAKRKTKNVDGFILVVGLLPIQNTFSTVFYVGRRLLHLIKIRFMLCIPCGLYNNLHCYRVPTAFITCTVFKDKRAATMTLIQ